MFWNLVTHSVQLLLQAGELDPKEHLFLCVFVSQRELLCFTTFYIISPCNRQRYTSTHTHPPTTHTNTHTHSYSHPTTKIIVLWMQPSEKKVDCFVVADCTFTTSHLHHHLTQNLTNCYVDVVLMTSFIREKGEQCSALPPSPCYWAWIPVVVSDSGEFSRDGGTELTLESQS